MKSDRQCLLAAVRKGDVQALLALGDIWLDAGHEKQSAEFDRLIRRVRWSLSAKRAAKARRVSPAENIRRSFREFVYRVNRIEKAWRLPNLIEPRSPFYDWLCDMAGKLLDVYRQRMMAEAATPGPHVADALDRSLGLRDGDLDWPGEWDVEAGE